MEVLSTQKRSKKFFQFNFSECFYLKEGLLLHLEKTSLAAHTKNKSIASNISIIDSMATDYQDEYQQDSPYLSKMLLILYSKREDFN